MPWSADRAPEEADFCPPQATKVNLGDVELHDADGLVPSFASQLLLRYACVWSQQLQFSGYSLMYEDRSSLFGSRWTEVRSYYVIASR